MMGCGKAYFKNRGDAAVQLRELMPIDRMKNEKWHMIAISPGGVDLIPAINRRLGLSVDFLFTQPIFAPQNPECEIACVSETEEIVINEPLANAFDIKNDYIYGEASRKHEEKILASIYKYRKGRHFESVRGKTVLIVDEGAETGLKMMTAVKTVLAMGPKAVYIAVPVLPSDVLDSFEPLADDIYFIHDPDDFIATRCYYETFETVSDEKIETILGEKIGI
jgi:putative phosphoribosyl transferase